MPPTVYIVIYTLYHHIHKLAEEVKRGLEASGVNAKIFQGNNNNNNNKNLKYVYKFFGFLIHHFLYN